MRDLSITIKLKSKKRVEMELRRLSLAFENLATAKRTLEESMEFMILTSTVLNFFLFLGLSIIVIQTWQARDLNYVLVFVTPMSMIKFFVMSWSSDRVHKQVNCLISKKICLNNLILRLARF
jgi:hypothetical protein